MDYFSKFLKTGSQLSPKPQTDHAVEFHQSWTYIKNTLLYPDERQLNKGIKSTDVPKNLQSMVDALVWESDRTEEGGTGACLEYLLKNDVLGTLVRLSETDRPAGIQAEVLRSVQTMVLLLDEQFLVHSAVHRAVLRLLRNCVGDDLQEQLDNHNKVMGAAKNSPRAQPSEYEEDLVNLLCILCSRIKTYRELLMIFFHDKHWYRSEPLFAVEEEDEEDEGMMDEDGHGESADPAAQSDALSPSPSQETITTTPQPPPVKKTEYEFLLFNYLLRFVHREGKIGDFARAGLLFLMDVAMSPQEAGPQAPEEEESSSAPPPSDPVTDAALALAEYILDGDFSEVLGAGLGAVYSLLPSKLRFPTPKPDPNSGNVMVIGGRGPETEEDLDRQELENERALALGIEEASNTDLPSKTDHFLKSLEFLQDVFRRNLAHDSVDAPALVGNAIVQSILDAVRRIFLENVLYPSVLECSDMDGSAVGVMSYIDLMIRNLQDGPLAELLVEFLMSEDSEEIRPRQRPFSMLTLGHSRGKSISSLGDKQAKARRRKSSAMVLLEMENPDTRKPSEYFTTMGRFTLKDLILANLRSKSQHTATSALQLLQSLLLHHPKISTEKLLVVIQDQHATSFPHPALASVPTQSQAKMEEEDDNDDTFRYPGVSSSRSVPATAPLFIQPETTYSTHEREMNLYLALISRVDPSHDSDAFSTGYDHYLHDALFAIQNQPAFVLPADNATSQGRRPAKHRLNPSDRVLSLLLESLRRFFSNTPEFNMALTGVLSTLAIHPDRSLAGWLTFASTDAALTYVITETDTMDDFLDEDGDDRSIDFPINERLRSSTQPSALPAAVLDAKSRPAVHTIFHGLVTQLERYRQTVDDFDKYLLERRQGLLFSENLTDALTLALEVTEEPTTLRTTESPPKPKPKAKPSTASSIVSFLTPRMSKSTKPSPSEPTTPPKNLSKGVSASPFGPHYQHTSSVTVEPYMAPSTDPWDPAKSTRWITDEEDVFGSGWGGRRETSPDATQNQSKQPAQITLSHLLDNVVILEEGIKELVAIIHARRSLGIDSVRYL